MRTIQVSDDDLRHIILALEHANQNDIDWLMDGATEREVFQVERNIEERDDLLDRLDVKGLWKQEKERPKLKLIKGEKK